MKVKIPFKKSKKEEQGPQKAFEEFAIDPKVLEELDNLPDETISEKFGLNVNSVAATKIMIKDFLAKQSDIFLKHNKFSK